MKRRELIKFTLQFIFEDKDQSKALKLHRLLKSYGAVSNISRPIEGIARKEDRCQAILDCLNPGRVYTTGQIWRVYCRKSTTGIKTFQRDLNTLVIEGKLSGFHTYKQGNTILWSRIDGG